VPRARPARQRHAERQDPVEEDVVPDPRGDADQQTQRKHHEADRRHEPWGKNGGEKTQDADTDDGGENKRNLLHCVDCSRL